MDWVALYFPSIEAIPCLRLINSHLDLKFAPTLPTPMLFLQDFYRLSFFVALACGTLTSRADIIRIETGVPDSLPKVPFSLPQPKPADSKADPLDPKQLVKASARELLIASADIEEDDIKRAIYLRSMAFEKDRTMQGKRELVGWCVKEKDLDSAIYWLQRAAHEDHLDEVRTDPLLKPLREDKRWAKLEPFLEASEKAWKESFLYPVPVSLTGWP